MDLKKNCAVFLGVGIAAASAFSVLSFPTTVLANPIQSSVNATPPVQGGPGGRSPGGSRDPNCLGKQSITALTPQSTLVATTATNPTFFFHIPSATAHSGVLVLQNAQKQTVYQTTVDLAGKSGIVGVELPSEHSPGLQMDQRYRWVFSVICDTNAPDQGGNPYVYGWMQRLALDPSLAEQLQVASPRDRIALYQQAGLWYDALQSLAKLRRSNPGDATLKTAWDKLLNSVGLGEIAVIQSLTGDYPHSSE